MASSPCVCNDSCQKKHKVACNIIKTLFVRFLFVVQCFISTWRVADVKQNNLYWLLSASMLGLLMDTFYSVGHRKGKEFKWVSTSFFFFLVAAVPPIWLLEFDRSDRYKLAVKNINSTVRQEAERLSDFVGISIPLYLEPDTWVQTLEQSLILLLIPTRWILPRGAMSRERLSQVLLVYLALGADIIELFDLFELKVVMQDFTIFIVILAVWSLSLIQFTLLLAASSKRKSRFAFVSPYSEPQLKSKKSGDERTFDPVEVLALCMTMILQDIPFLAVRLYIMIKYKLVTNTLLFFTCKNIYVIILQIYRIVVITCVTPDESNSKRPTEEHTPNAESSSDTVTIQLDGVDIGLSDPNEPVELRKKVPHEVGEGGANSVY